MAVSHDTMAMAVAAVVDVAVAVVAVLMAAVAVAVTVAMAVRRGGREKARSPAANVSLSRKAKRHRIPV